jgi:hypothetical protein
MLWIGPSPSMRSPLQRRVSHRCPLTSPGIDTILLVHDQQTSRAIGWRCLMLAWVGAGFKSALRLRRGCVTRFPTPCLVSH